MWKKSPASTWNVTPQQELRSKQIQSLHSTFENVRELQKDVQYEIPFQLGSQPAWILVTFGPNFPESPPILQIKPTVKHPWVAAVDGSTIIHDKLHPTEWNMHASLGKLCQECISEFQSHPPTITGSIEKKDLKGNGTLGSATQLSTPRQSGPIAIHGLEQVSDEQVEELLSDPIALELFVEDLEAIQKMKTVRDEIKQGNVTLAKKSMDKEPQLQELTKRLDELKKELTDERGKLEQSLKAQQSVMKKYSRDEILRVLAKASQESEDLSESAITSFMQGTSTVDAFLRGYRASRKQYHLRNSRYERVLADPTINPTFGTK